MPKVGDVIDAQNANWRFSGAASEHFDQHIARSVPFYNECHDLVLALSDFFVQQDSLCYDLGCATGGLTAALARRHEDKNLRCIGLDKEPDMTRLARERCADLPRVNIVCDDVTETDFERADLIVAFYTLQFVPPRSRQALLDALYASLNWGGGLVLFEKVRAPDARFQDMATALYHEFKLAQGYAADEIFNKARSLKGVLEPFSVDGNMGLLQRAGFTDITSVFKYVCFEGFVAIK